MIREWWLRFWIRRDMARLERLKRNRQNEIDKINNEYNVEIMMVESAIARANASLTNIRSERLAMRAIDRGAGR